jgi:MFS transporter, ACS family, glucarate transporter
LSSNLYESPKSDPSGLPLGSPEIPTRVRYQVMFFLGLLAFLTYFDRICIQRASKYISKDLGIDDFQMGLIMGAFWLAYALFELPAGRMGDKHGARVTLSRIVLAWSIFTALSGCASGFLSLFLYRFIFGIGEAGAFPNMARIQSRWLPIVSRPFFGGMLWMLARWGGAFSIPLFGFMIRTFDSPGFREFAGGLPLVSGLADVAAWRISFWVAGLMGIVWILMFYPWFRDHPSEKPTVNQAELELITKGAPPEVRGHSMAPSLWRSLLTNRSLLALCVLYLCSSFGWSFFASWMHKYFEEKQLEAKVEVSAPLDVVAEPKTELRKEIEAEWMAAAPLLCGGVTCLLGGWLCNILTHRTGSKRWGRAILPVCGYSTSALAMFCIPFAKTNTQIMVLLCLAEAAHDLGQGANWSTIVDIGGKYAGVAAGLVNTIGNMGNAFQPAIGAWIRTHYGWNTMFLVYSAAFLIAASMWSIIDPRRTFYETDENQ